MARTAAALYVFSDIASGVGDQDSRSLYAFSDIASDATIDKDAQELYMFTNVAYPPVDKAAQDLYAFSSIEAFTDVNDPLQVDLLDPSLVTEHVLRAK